MYSDIYHYCGEWKDGYKHGKGVEYSKSFGVFKGIFVDGKRNGKGTLITS